MLSNRSQNCQTELARTQTSCECLLRKNLQCVDIDFKTYKVDCTVKYHLSETVTSESFEKYSFKSSMFPPDKDEERGAQKTVLETVN